MSTLRVSNIEAKADPSSPSIDEKLKVTNSNGDVLVHIDGKTAGITTVGINTTDSSFTVDAAQNIEFIGIVTATKFSLSGGGEITGGDGNFTGIVTAASIDATSATFSGNVSIAGTLTYEDVTSIDAIGIITARSGINIAAGGAIVSGGATVVGLSTFTKIAIGATDGLWPGYPVLPPNLHVHSNVEETGGACGISFGPDTHGTGPRHTWMYWAGGSTQINTFTGGLQLAASFGVGLGHNVGIGTTRSPGSERLHVVGDSKFVGIVTSKSLDLDVIDKDINDTAVDVFVYDTTKDSDGGAWRKRTQNTSWYTETLNTATRGSRKEFPAVAVIVAELGEVTIYDGDDPDLPMWMVFKDGVGSTSSDSTFLGVENKTISSVIMLNGILCVGFSDSGGWGVSEIGFISDSQRWWWNTGTYKQPASIAERNVEINYVAVDTSSSAQLSNAVVSDVAMAVLPNAPIDSATGLPVPTIAVATANVTSVIRDDGTVVDYTSFGPIERIEIDSSYVYASTTTGGNDYIFKSPLLSADGQFNDNITAGSGGWYANSVNNASETPTLKDMTVTGMAVAKDNTVIRSGNDGIEVFDGNVTTIDGNEAIMPFAYVTSDYNTGYMVGDIKGAFLSSTDATNMTGGNLISNGDAWSGAQSSVSSTPPTGWTGALGAQWLTSSGGDGSYIRLVNAGAGQGGPNSYMYQAITTIAGRKYKISLTQYHHATISVFFAASTTAGGTNLLYNLFSSSSSNTPRDLSGTFTATGTTTYIRLGIISGTNTYSVGWDNVVVTEVDEDRRINANGLHSFGTITKTPVATGAELVAYSGFSASNYLQQPYNSDLNFGTGDFSFMAWIYPTNDNVGGIISRGSNGVYGPYGVSYSATIITLVCSSDWNESNDGGSWGTIIQTASGVAPKNVWSHVVAVKSGTTAHVYTNGVLRGTDTSAVNPKVPTSNFIPTMIGVERTPLTGAIGRPFPGSLALVRASASAPSAEQVKKMYDDEKVLFHENAKATLYGSSDAVTALAYDEVTDQLHVGTSAGRSDFQGLRRINNTTTAVTTAISAHDEFIIEQ